MLKNKPRQNTFAHKIPDAPRVLVFAICGIGDLILGTPLFSSIKKAMPNSQITVVLRDDLPRDVLNENPDIFRVIHYPKTSVLYFFPKIPIKVGAVRSTLKKLILEIGLILKLRKCRFNISMFLLPGGLSGWPLVAYFCNAQIRVGPEYIHWMKIWKWCFTHTITWDDHRHTVENNLDNLRVLGFKDFNKDLSLFIKSDDRKAAVELLNKQRVGMDNTVVGIHTGGGNSQRYYWPVDRFVQVSRHLITVCKYRVMVFFGPQEPGAFSAFEGVPIVPIMNLPFGVVCGLIEQCSLFISSDTGLGHAAAALQVPTLTLFGNANKNKHHHWGNKNFAINKLPESFTTSVVQGYLAGHAGKKAIESISVEEVITAVDSIFAEMKTRK